MASRFGEIKKTAVVPAAPIDDTFRGHQRPKQVIALYYWNWLRDDLDRPDDIAITIKPIEASTPLPIDMPVGFYPDDKNPKDNNWAFGGTRELAAEMIDRDYRFVYNTSIGGIRADESRYY